MNKIGYTQDNGVIVVMTEGEYGAVRMLAHTVHGRPIKIYSNVTVDTSDMEPAFRAVLAWVQARALSGELRALADAFAEGVEDGATRQEDGR